jgi:hypothetical protein
MPGHRFPIRRGIVVVATVMVCLLAAAEGAAIASTGSLAGIKIGDSPKRVRHVLGTPSKILRNQGICPANALESYKYPDRLRVDFGNFSRAPHCRWSGTKVWNISTKSPKDRFDGMHVGSHLSANRYLKRRPKATCDIQLLPLIVCHETLSKTKKYKIQLEVLMQHRRIKEITLDRVCKGNYGLIGPDCSP